MRDHSLPIMTGLLLLAICSAGFTHKPASVYTGARPGVSHQNPFLATFVPVQAADSGCSPVLWSTPNGSTWAGCAQATACNGECVHESEAEGANTIHWCDCPGGAGIGCYAEVTVNAAGIVIDLFCEEISCEICTETEPPMPLPDGPNIKYRACTC